MAPGAVMAAYQNRRFVQTAVQFITACEGIRQFVDTGCGFIGPGAVHEVALGIAPDARVVYVDRAPSVISQVNAVLAGHPAAVAMPGDLGQPSGILSDPALRSFIDVTRPVAVILAAVLHFLADEDDPHTAVAAFTHAMAPGSQLLISHAAVDRCTAASARSASRVYETAGVPLVPRGHAQIVRFFDGLELMAPGVVSGAAWRPGYAATDPRGVTFYAGLGRKP